MIRMPGIYMKLAGVLLAVLMSFTAGGAYAAGDGDFQIWNTDVEEFKVRKDFKLILEEEFRWKDDAGEFYYQHYDAGLFYDVNKYLNVGGGYRQIYEVVNKKFKPEYAPYITATLFWDIYGFKFDDRSRMEYRDFNYKTDSWRYRNKATLKLPWKFTGMEIQPYLSDEILMVFGNIPGGINQNRLSFGLGMSITKNIKAEIYYMLLTTKSSVKNSTKWTYANVLGLKAKLVF